MASKPVSSVEVAGHEVVGGDFLEFGFLPGTLLHHEEAAGWKRQPLGGLRALGTSPDRTNSSPSSSRCDGREAAKRALVYGCMGLFHRSKLSAISTVLPRYITTIRSLMCATASKSWPP